MKWSSLLTEVGLEVYRYGHEGVFCGIRKAEFRKRVICGIIDAERSANYTL